VFSVTIGTVSALVSVPSTSILVYAPTAPGVDDSYEVTGDLPGGFTADVYLQGGANGGPGPLTTKSIPASLNLAEWAQKVGRVTRTGTGESITVALSTVTVTGEGGGGNPAELTACCMSATGACGVAATAADCAALGGTPQSTATCTPGLCPPPAGACCRTGLCQVTRQAVCTGSWGGAGTTCAPAPGVNPCCRADFNNSGAVSVQDIFDFLATYFRGCP
jgi:hypothetical protein